MSARVCSVDGCERGGQLRRGMCHACYEHWRRYGTTDRLPLPSPAERLTTGLERKPNGCLEWTRATSPLGYGRINVDGKYLGTHRLAWSLANGPIPDGLFVLHHCDNPPCAQTEPTEGFPEGHLFLGTDADNSADMDAKGRRVNGSSANKSKTHCPANHPYDAANTYVDKNGGRSCRMCHRDAVNAAYHQRRRAA